MLTGKALTLPHDAFPTSVWHYQITQKSLLFDLKDFRLTRIPQLTQTSWKRGVILEQRRRLTLKFQHHVGLRQVIAMKVNLPFAAPLITIWTEAQTHRLCCARIAPRAFRRSQLRNPG